MKNKKYRIIIGVLLMLGLVTGCGNKNTNNTNYTSITSNIEKIFTSRDLKQTVDLTDASSYEVNDNEDITISQEGIYIISGNASDVTINVDVDDEEKVQLVLDNLTINNKNKACIYVKNADKVFITTKNNNTLEVTDTFESDEDAVIFSKDDLVLNGTGTLYVSSTASGIISNDDLKITGGTINITSANHSLKAHDSIAINDGVITINSQNDGLHAEYNKDDSVGYIYIAGGTLNITAKDDGIHATTSLEIDGGTLNIDAHEALEATYVQINDGTLNITASDDGINAFKGSSLFSTPTIEINGGYITIKMAAGDTDAIDANGDIYVNGGTLDITASSPFDYDNNSKYTGGTIIVNGKETNTITNQMIGDMRGNNKQKGIGSHRR